MLKHAVKRILLAILTIFIIAAITFFAMNAIPGGPFAKEKAPEARIQAVCWRRASIWTSLWESSSSSTSETS